MKLEGSPIDMYQLKSRGSGRGKRIKCKGQGTDDDEGCRREKKKKRNKKGNILLAASVPSHFWLLGGRKHFMYVW